MKRFFRIFFVILLLIVVSLFAFPMIFKTQILETVKKESAKYINAELAINDVSVTLFDHFPHITLELDSLAIINKAPFEGKKLAAFESLHLTVDVFKIISDGNIVVNDIELLAPEINVEVNENGDANYDIAIDSETEEVEEPVTDEAPSDGEMSFSLVHYGIYNANIHYLDVPGEMEADIKGLTHEGSGDFTSNEFDLNTNSEIDALTFVYDEVGYLYKTHITLDAVLSIIMDKMRFEFKENSLVVNGLELGINGMVEMPNDPIAMDLKIDAKKGDFKQVLSIVPGVYLEGFEDLKASGAFSLSARLGGAYSETSMPTMDIAMKVNNALIQYPDLPSNISNINSSITVKSNGAADMDDIVVNVQELNAKVAGSDLNSSLYLSNPMSDPFLKMRLFTKMNLAKLQEAVPMEGMDMQGLLDANLVFESNMSAIEKEEYEKVKSEGNLSLNNLEVKGDSMPYPISSELITAEFSPEFVGVTLRNFKTTGVQANATGFVKNFIPYFLHNQTLTGEFDFESSEIDLNPYMVEEASSETETNASADNTESEDEDYLTYLRIPSNIELEFKGKVAKMLYEDMTFYNMNAKAHTEKGVLYLENADMDLLDGKAVMYGQFDSKPEKPIFDFSFKLKDLDIQRTVESIATIAELAPIAKAAVGIFNSEFKMAGNIGSDLMPILNSLNGGGRMMTKKVEVNNFKAFNAAAEKLKINALKKQALENVDLKFELADGSLFIKPFETKIGAMDAKIVGRTGLDKSLDYTINLDIPSKLLPSEAVEIFNGMAGKLSGALGKDVSIGDKVNVDLFFTNTVDDIKVKTKLNNTGKSEVDAAKAKIKEELDAKKKEAEERAKAEIEKKKQEAEEAARKAKEEAKKKIEEEKKKKEAEIQKKIDEEKQKAKDKIKDKAKDWFK